MLPRVTAIRYVLPLREGGSLPGLMEADDEGTYVVKFTGAGQGPKTLIAEVICAALLRALDLPVPELALVHVDAALGPAEPDEEIQDLLRASVGWNLGIDYLPGALDFDAAAAVVDETLAGRVLWFDALVGNVDRTWRNPNMLYWHRRLHLIDHGATLTFHHRWTDVGGWAARPYDAAQHALIEFAPAISEADAAMAPLLSGGALGEIIRNALSEVPDGWLDGPDEPESPDELRLRYAQAVEERFAARTQWLPSLQQTIEAVAHGSGCRSDAAGRTAGDAPASVAGHAGPSVRSASSARSTPSGRPAWLTGEDRGTR